MMYIPKRESNWYSDRLVIFFHQLFPPQICHQPWNNHHVGGMQPFQFRIHYQLQIYFSFFEGWRPQVGRLNLYPGKPDLKTQIFKTRSPPGPDSSFQILLLLFVPIVPQEHQKDQINSSLQSARAHYRAIESLTAGARRDRLSDPQRSSVKATIN